MHPLKAPSFLSRINSLLNLYFLFVCFVLFCFVLFFLVISTVLCFHCHHCYPSPFIRAYQLCECPISYKQESAVFMLGTRFSRFSRHVWQFVGTCIELELCFTGQNPLYLRFVTVHGLKAKFTVTQKLKIAITGNKNKR